MERFKLGDTATYTQTITDADIKSFAGISGDNNPVHMSDEYAEGSRFKKRIAQAVSNCEKVIVAGDYDCDGISATTKSEAKRS